MQIVVEPIHIGIDFHIEGLKYILKGFLGDKLNWEEVWTLLITNGWSSRGKKGEVMCYKSSYSNVH